MAAASADVDQTMKDLPDTLGSKRRFSLRTLAFWPMSILLAALIVFEYENSNTGESTLGNPVGNPEEGARVRKLAEASLLRSQPELLPENFSTTATSIHKRGDTYYVLMLYQVPLANPMLFKCTVDLVSTDCTRF